jgi:Flp pilus assembly protein TadG
MKYIRIFKQLNRDERGQSMLIVVGALVALIALMAAVVDGGNAYVQRRKVQNAMDAGSSAGALALGQNKTNGQIVAAINDYVSKNGVDPAQTQSYYVVQDSQGNNIVVHSATISSFGANSAAPKKLDPGTGTQLPVVGVQVEGTKQFNTYFAGVIGWHQMQVAGSAAAFAIRGACSADNLFPIAISSGTFVDTNGDGIPDITYESDNATYYYRIYENKSTTPSNYVYVTWNSDTSAGTLTSNMANVSQSGEWSVNDDLSYVSASLSSSSVRSGLSSSGVTNVPIYDTVAGTPPNSKYNIKGFARMRITNVFDGGSGNRYIDVKFQQFVDPRAEGGCTNYGVATDKLRPPINPSRALVGTVKIDKLTVTNGSPTSSHVPVDVVNVLDISGSMNDPFGSVSKIAAAKQALTSFNNNMQPTKGDQVALVTFPLISSGSTYSFSCTQSGNHSYYYYAQQRNALTSNISGVNSTINGLSANGGTPLAAGMQQGRQTALGANHQSSHLAIIILASDGLANIRLSGQWTGFQGNTYSSPSCNHGAEQDAIDQADIAKGDTNPHDGQPDTIIFTIAIGNDFNPALLQSLASTDTDPSKPHYFRATDANSMASIYQQISNRVQTIGNETCNIIHTGAFANGATLVTTNQATGESYTVHTTSTGEFVINNVNPGTFLFQSASVTDSGVTYDVFTDGVGGPPLTSNPTAVVDIGSGTYRTDLALMSNQSFSCGN